MYVDGALALEDVPYRASTGLVDLPVTEVGIAPADGDVIATFPFELTYVVVASGIVGDGSSIQFISINACRIMKLVF